MANVTKHVSVMATMAIAVSVQDVLDAFSSTATTFGATISNTSFGNNLFEFDVTYTDAKTEAQVITFINDVVDDLDGEVTVDSPNVNITQVVITT